MRFEAAFVGAAFALGVTACSKGCGEDLPDPDVCSGPREGRIDSAAVGRGDADGFTPFQDGDVVFFLFTEGGEATLPLKFQLTGPDVPPCVEHRTELLGCPAGETCEDGLATHLALAAPVHTYPAEDGAASETRALYLRLVREDEPPDGSRLELVSEIGGIDVSVELWLEEAGPDATPAPLPDAAP